MASGECCCDLMLIELLLIAAKMLRLQLAHCTGSVKIPATYWLATKYIHMHTCSETYAHTCAEELGHAMLRCARLS